VYTALCFVTLLFVYFCVGEVPGRTMEEIDGLFRQVCLNPVGLCFREALRVYRVF
jgi:hypothetical protein